MMDTTQGLLRLHSLSPERLPWLLPMVQIQSSYNSSNQSTLSTFRSVSFLFFLSFFLTLAWVSVPWAKLPVVDLGWGQLWSTCCWCPSQLPLASWYTHLAATAGAAANSLHTHVTKNCPGLMGAVSLETLGRLQCTDWLTQRSKSPDPLLQVGTTPQCKLYSRLPLNQNKSGCHLWLHCWLPLPSLSADPHSFGNMFSEEHALSKPCVPESPFTFYS